MEIGKFGQISCLTQGFHCLSQKYSENLSYLILIIN